MTDAPDLSEYEIILRYRADGVEAILRELDLQGFGATADAAVMALRERFVAVNSALADARKRGIEPDAASHNPVPLTPSATVQTRLVQPSAVRELLMFTAKFLILLLPVALGVHLLVKRVENMPKPWKAQYLMSLAGKASAMTPEQIDEVRQALRIVVRQYGPLLQELRPLWIEMDGTAATEKKP